MKKNHNIRLKGQLKWYMQWPAFMTILLAAMNVWIYRTDRRAGLLMFVFLIIYVVIGAVWGGSEYDPERAGGSVRDFAG